MEESMFKGPRNSLLFVFSLLVGLACQPDASAQGPQAPTPGQNVNMVSGITWPDGDPFLQRQNEPSIAVSTRNACHLLAGANDYRTVDLNFLATGETGDAWLGLFKSFDCGASWQSTLLPGYPLDKTPEGINSPLKKWNAASDPVVRSGPSGFFGYSGIAFTRGTNQGQVFFSRFVDLNNKENGSGATGAVSSSADPIRYVGTSIIATGSARRFLDKPWMAIDIERGGAGCTLQVPQPPPNGVVTQSVGVGNIYIAFTAFNYSQAGVLLSSQILFSRSSDCGATWSTPITLTANDDDDNSLNQGPTIAIDPRTGFVYVAWRRFATQFHRDAIVAAASISGGRWFTPAVPVITLAAFDPNHPPTGPNGPFSFFDQVTSGTAMRTNAYPSLAVADSGGQGIPGQIYLAWSQRGVGPNGEARIMMVASPTTLTWPKPFPIDNGPLSDDSGNVFARGHQFMPQLAFSGGKLVAVYYDQRIDHTLGLYTPNNPFQPDPSDGKLYKEDRAAEGELLTNPASVFTPFFDDQGLTQRRHTIEMMLSQAVPGPIPAFTPAVRVSQYIFGLRGDVSNPSQLQQLQADPPNLPLFANGSVPFFGDYIDVAPLMMVPTPSGGWIFNTSANPGQAPVFYIAWTSNQDVRPPADGNWKNHTPVGAGGPSVFDPTQPRPNCVPGQEGMRNQNIYSSRVTQGLLVSSPQTLKPLSATLQRSFVVLVQNLTSSDRTFHMTIANQPPGGFASFTAGINNPGAPVTFPSPVTMALDVDIPPHSGIARPVFAASSSPLASITVNVVETTPAPVNSGLASFVAFNSDPSSPLTLLNPDGSTLGDVGVVEIYSPSTTDPTIFNPNAPNPNAPNPNGPNTGLSNPNAPNPNAPNPNAPNPNAPNPNAPNPNAPNPDLANPNAPNPNAPNSVVANPNAPNPNAPNPNAPNPNAPNTNITNTAIFDAVYTVTNNGNTTGSYHVKLVGNNPGNIPLQLAVNKTYQTPTSSSYENPTGAMSCQLTTENHNNVQALINNPPLLSVANLNDPNILDPSSGNTTFSLFPGETAVLVLRGYFASYTDPMKAFTDFKSLTTQIAPVVVPHAANTNTNTIVVSSPIFITTSVLPDAVVGTPYTTTLTAIGGTPPYTWSTPSGGLSPAALNPNTGVISFTPAITGPVNFVAQVTDSSNPQRTTIRALTIHLVAPLAITTSSLPPAVQNVNYNNSLSSTGGTPPITWNLGVAGLPLGLNFGSNGSISGAAIASGTFNIQVQATDSSSPPQTTAPVPLSLTVFANTGHIAFVQQPTRTVRGQAIAPPLTVQVIDNFGAVVPGVLVTIAIGNNPSGGVLSGSTAILTDPTGIATFSNLSIDKPGVGYSLIASAMGAGGTSSNSFDIVSSIAVAAGGFHSCALLSGGTVQCWGHNQYGQLGSGTTTDSSVPVTVSGLTGAIAIGAGADHTCALLSDGTVQCWGYNLDGELGNGTTTSSSTPVAVSGLSGATSIAVGSFHACALLSGGAVECWGINTYGGLGNGTTTSSSTPVAVSGLNGATAVAAGEFHTCALLSGGTAKCWGLNTFGALGNGTTTNSSTPVAVTGLSGATAIAGGVGHTCGLLSSGIVECWGSNVYGQLGIGTTTDSSTPVALTGPTGLTGATAIVTGAYHTCALVTGGIVECWGWNGFGQLGIGTTTDSHIPAALSGLSATTISAGYAHTCAVLPNGTVECWGDNQNGDLGNGTTTGSSIPVGVSGLSVIPNPPTNVAQGVLGTTFATVIWEFSTTNGVVGYNVYRSTTSGTGYVLVGSVPATAFSFVDTTPQDGTNYYYVVTALGPGNVASVFSNQVAIALVMPPPANLVAVVPGVMLTWTPPAAIGIVGYNVWRSTISGSGYVRINSSPVTVPTFTDATVLGGTTYYYVVTAFGSNGIDSTYSNQATAVIP